MRDEGDYRLFYGLIIVMVLFLNVILNDARGIGGPPPSCPPCHIYGFDGTTWGCVINPCYPNKCCNGACYSLKDCKYCDDATETPLSRCDSSQCEICDGNGNCLVCGGDANQACCGGQCYDLTTPQSCCYGQLYSWKDCKYCDRDITMSVQSTCDPSWYQQTCDGNGHCVECGGDANMGCCNGQCYDKRTKKCCHDTANKYICDINETCCNGNCCEQCKVCVNGTTCTPIKIKSQTVATIPSDRTRTTIGIGEAVYCYTDPSADVDWERTGDGTITIEHGPFTFLLCLL